MTFFPPCADRVLAGDVLATGRLRFPGGQGRTSYAARRDLAEAAAQVLISDGHAGRTYELNSGENHRFADVARALGRVLGRPIAYDDVPLETWREELHAGGMSEPEVELMVQLAQSIRLSEADHPSGDLARLLGRAPTGLEQFLRETHAR